MKRDLFAEAARANRDVPLIPADWLDGSPSVVTALKDAIWSFKLSELNRCMNMVHAAQLDALRAEMKRDEEPQV